MKRLYFASLNDCNEDCLFCVRRGDEKPISFMSTKKAKEVLSKKRKEDYEEVYFDGGEPTLRKDLTDLIKHAKLKKYKLVNVLTNAVLLADKKLTRKILGVKNTKNFTLSFSVSLHSHKKEISEKLVNKRNTFEKTIKGIKNLLEDGAQEVSIYHIITKYNYKDLPAFVEFIHQEFPQIKNATFSFIYPAGAALKNKAIFPRLSKIEPYFQEAATLCKKNGLDFSLSTCGTVPLCFLRGYEDVLIKQQDLDQPEKVGLIDAEKDVRYQLASKDYHKKTKIKSSKCKNCIYNEKCGGLWKDYAKKYGVNELNPVLRKNKKPNVLLLLTGFSCNNNCIFCSNLADRDFNSSTEELFDKIEKSYADGFRIIELIGGEVPIRPDFFKLIAHAKKIGFEDIRLTSNGRIFAYPEFAKKSAEAGLKIIVISLYGHNKKIHEASTQTPGSFDQTVEGIKNVTKNKMGLIINTVVSKINYKHLDNLATLVYKLNPLEWHLLELLPDGRAVKLYDALSVPYGELSFQFKKITTSAGEKLKRIDFFDFPFCIFDEKILTTKNINIFTPQKRYEDIEIRAHDNSTRVEKVKKGNKYIFQDKYKTKPLLCEECIYFENCGGIATPYYEKYKDKEIKKLATQNNFLVKKNELPN